MSQSLSQKTVIESALALCPYPTAKIPAKWTICKQKSEAVEGGDKEGAEGRLEGPGGEAIFPWRAGTRMPYGRCRGENGQSQRGVKRKIGEGNEGSEGDWPKKWGCGENWTWVRIFGRRMGPKNSKVNWLPSSLDKVWKWGKELRWEQDEMIYS